MDQDIWLLRPSTCGAVLLPESFDIEAYDGVLMHAPLIADPGGPHRNAFFVFSQGWNGLAFRLRAMVEQDREFQEWVGRSTIAPPEDFYQQERALYGCVASALSALECFYMATYGLVAPLVPASFPLLEPEHLFLTPPRIAKAFVSWRCDDAFSRRLIEVAASPQLEQLRMVRDVLAHRGVMTRNIQITPGAPITSAFPANPKDLPLEYNYSALVNRSTTATHAQWMCKTLSLLTGSFRDLLRSA